jgi:hypothetical protein
MRERVLINQPDITQNDGRDHSVMITHSDVTLEDFVTSAQLPRFDMQLCLAERGYGVVGDIRWHKTDLGWNSGRDERIHGVIT